VKQIMDRYQDSQSWMSNDERLDHESIDHALSNEELDDEDADWSDASSEQPFNIGLWIQVLWQHPLVLWSGIWAIVFLVAGLAFAGLISPYLSAQNSETAEPLPGQPPVAVRPEGDTLPIWSVGAIAAACAVGSLLISQRLKYQHTRQSFKTKNRTEVEHSPHAPVYPLARPQTALPQAAMPQSLPVQPFQPTASMPISPSAVAPSLPSASEEPVVTIVPADESTPLDWQEASLADMMDIRYRRPSHR
jgi:hypothetical protein